MVASLGDQPQDVLRGAADEVLAWLKVRMNTAAHKAHTVSEKVAYSSGRPLVDTLYR